MAESHSDPATKVLLVKQFSKIPQERLNAEHLSELIVFAHRFVRVNYGLICAIKILGAGLIALPLELGTHKRAIGNHSVSEDKNWAPLGVAGESEYGLFFETFNDAFI